MANIKVSEMLEATSFEDGDYAMIVQGRSSKKISRTNMLKNQNGILLWKNSSPDTSYESNFIYNLYGDYDCYEIIYKKAKDSEICYSTGKILKGKSTNLISWDGIEETGSYLEIRWREFSYYGEDGHISNCQTKQANATQKGVNNDAVIPLYIIGYKAELFD